MVATRATENNHLGEGLWQLHQLVMYLQGQLWILTGDAELSVAPDKVYGQFRKSTIQWSGVAIEVILPIESTFVSPPGELDESIARRFGI